MTEDDNLAAFVREHGSPAAAIAVCERPDWIIRIAFEAAKDRKAVIRYAAIAAGGANRTKWSPVIDSFVPRVTPLDAVEEWTDSGDILGERKGWLRPFEIATWYIIPIAIAADKLVLSPSLTTGALTKGQVYAISGVGVAAGVVLLAVAAKLVMNRSLERQVSALDERTAREIVIEEVTKGVTKNPTRKPSVLKMLRLMLGKLVR